MSSKIKVNKTLFLLMAVIFIVTGCMFQRPDYLKMMPATELNQILQNEDIFLVDVHTPEQQHIKGTDLFVPYNEIENAAAKSLYKLGYRNLINLEGGTNAWRKAGFDFE